MKSVTEGKRGQETLISVPARAHVGVVVGALTRPLQRRLTSGFVCSLMVWAVSGHGVTADELTADELTADELTADETTADELTVERFRELHQQLQPGEELWRTIPWETSLLQAQALAAEQKKPLFIWAMDGHPLGCT